MIKAGERWDEITRRHEQLWKAAPPELRQALLQEAQERREAATP